MEGILLPVMAVLLVVLLGLTVLLWTRLGALEKKNQGEELQDLLEELHTLRRESTQEGRLNRQELTQAVQSSVKEFGNVMLQGQLQTAQAQDKRLEELNQQLTQRQSTLEHTVSDLMKKTQEQLSNSAYQNEQKLENLRTTIQNRLVQIQQDNQTQLERMRQTVDEKLQKTLEERIGQSFSLVNQRLEQVYKGLGEMQTLASGVGDLKKVLSNVKTRGILGEIQLGAILQEILTKEQYAVNVPTKKGSANVVEFAVKMPGDGEEPVYLPIDSKFPVDPYTQLQEAYDAADPVQVEQARRELKSRIKAFAKDIHDKYIDPPNTTDFAILFLPVEGLYAEAVRLGLVEDLQRSYKVNLAGPTTMAALLNSLQMGFRTLAIQKRSGEVWQVLGAVKTEFDKFANVLVQTQQRLEQANSELDKLVGVRTRQIQRKLKGVESLQEEKAAQILLSGEEESDR